MGRSWARGRRDHRPATARRYLAGLRERIPSLRQRGRRRHPYRRTISAERLPTPQRYRLLARGGSARQRQIGELAGRGCRNAVLARDDAQRLHERHPTGEALLGALGKDARQDYIKLGRLGRIDRGRRRRWRLHVGHDQLRRCARERHHAGDDLVGGDAERIQIAAAIDALGRRLLGRDILRRPHENARARQALTTGLGRLGDPKIGQQHAPVGIDHDILRLDIAVDCALRVGIIERRRDRLDDSDRVAQPQCSALFDDRVERTAAHILHRDIAQPVVLADIVDRDDIRVPQIRSGDGLAIETPGELGIDRQLRRQHLERHRALEQGIARAVHARHAAAPDLFLDQVAAQLLSDQTGQQDPPTAWQRAGQGRNPCGGGFRRQPAGWRTLRRPLEHRPRIGGATRSRTPNGALARVPCWIACRRDRRSRASPASCTPARHTTQLAARARATDRIGPARRIGAARSGRRSPGGQSPHLVFSPP